MARVKISNSINTPYYIFDIKRDPIMKRPDIITVKFSLRVIEQYKRLKEKIRLET